MFVKGIVLEETYRIYLVIQEKEFLDKTITKEMC